MEEWWDKEKYIDSKGKDLLKNNAMNNEKNIFNVEDSEFNIHIS